MGAFRATRVLSQQLAHFAFIAVDGPHFHRAYPSPSIALLDHLQVLPTRPGPLFGGRASSPPVRRHLAPHFDQSLPVPAPPIGGHWRRSLRMPTTFEERKRFDCGLPLALSKPRAARSFVSGSINVQRQNSPSRSL